MLNFELCLEMCGRVAGYLKRNGSMSRIECVAFLVDCYGSVDIDKLYFIDKLFCAGILTE